MPFKICIVQFTVTHCKKRLALVGRESKHIYFSLLVQRGEGGQTYSIESISEPTLPVIEKLKILRYMKNNGM